MKKSIFEHVFKKHSMLTKKLLMSVIVASAIMPLAGCDAMYKDLKHDIKVLRGEAAPGETIMGNSAADKTTADKTTVGDTIAGKVTAGEFTSKEYTLSKFEILHVKVNADVKVHRADNPKVVVAAHPSMHDKIKLRTTNDKLEICIAGNAQSYPRFTVDVYCPPLSEVGAAENSTLEFSDDVTRSKFTVGQLENGEIRGSINCETIRLDMVGYGTILLTGSAKTATIKMVGDGTIDAQNLTVNKTNVNVVGKGKILTHTTEKLSVLGVGFGTVHYRGNPTVHSLDMGPVRVIKLSDTDTSDNSGSTQPVSKPIDSAMELTHTAFDGALVLTGTVLDGAMTLTRNILGIP